MYLKINDQKITLINYNINPDILILCFSKDYDMLTIYNLCQTICSYNLELSIYDNTDMVLETFGGYNTMDSFTYQSSSGYYAVSFSKYSVINLKGQIDQYVNDIKTTLAQFPTENKSISLVAKLSAQSFSDHDALSVKDIYDTWEYLCQVNYYAKVAGYKFTHENKLYRTVQDEFTFQSQWIPGQGTSAIFTQITESEDEEGNESGTIDNPITVPSDVHTNSFTYITGKYYLWNEKIYKCERDDDDDGVEYSLVYDPSQLVGQYFSEVESETISPL